MRTISEKYFSEVSLRNEAYGADFAVLDRYLKFSEELLRLALAGIGGLGFLAGRFAFGGSSAGLGVSAQSPALDTRLFLAASLFLLALSALGALGARFYATDSAAHFVRWLRLKEREKSPDDSTGNLAKIKEKLEAESKSLSGDVEKNRWLIVASTVSLALGFAAAAISFSMALFA